MKQKIVMEVRRNCGKCKSKAQINCEKCKTKVMKIAAEAKGVDRVEIQWDKKQVVVVGDGVDASDLTILLRKKVGCTDLISVVEVKPDPDPKPPKKVPNPPVEPPQPTPCCHRCGYWTPCCNQCPQFIAYVADCEPSPSICPIM